jgi:N-acetyl-gamma-glutamyl-phosphate reductase
VSNPGCYPTSILLALVPLLRGEAIVEKEVISDAKSGVSGAGRKLQEEYLFYRCNENIVPYRPVRHSHIGEMEHQIYNLTSQDLRLSFTPHLVPLNRGILSTIYCKLRKGKDVDEVEQRYSQFYGEEPFVQVLPSGRIPGIRDVVGSNSCRIGYIYDERAGILKIFSSLDNLLKGAAGQAVQNMNVMFGFSEIEGLSRQALG